MVGKWPHPGKILQVHKSYTFLLKTLEKMVSRYLLENTFNEKPFHRNQYAYRQGRPIKSSLHILVHRLEKVLSYKWATLVVIFVVEEAFDKPIADIM